MRRTQIYLDDRQDDVLTRRAAAEGVTKSALIRRAIDDYLEDGNDAELRLERFRTAVDAVAGVAPYLLPGEEYVERLRSLDAAREQELERRRRA